MSSPSVPTSGSISGALNDGAGNAQTNQGISLDTFIASLAASFIAFAAQFVVFVIIKKSQPRTYLVPERERTKAPPSGFFTWVLPVFRTSNSDFIAKCGLDAYFFLRYLRMLLKIFVPLALLILPILLPINAVHGRGRSAVGNSTASANNVTGLDTLAWGNVAPTKTRRYWAHLVLALVVIFWVCYTFFDELRGYIRLRQAYLTSPQHRLRASATTVLVTSVPRKWLTVEALDGLFDVFPGGLRNIWINRNFDELNNKVHQRNKLAKSLEGAETNLIKNAKKAQMERSKKEAKRAGKPKSKEDKKRLEQEQDDTGLAMAQGDGVSSGNPHQVKHTLAEALGEGSSSSSRASSPDRTRTKPWIPIPVVGQGLQVVGHGFDKLGKTVLGGFKKVERDVDGRLNTTGGFVPDEAEHVAVTQRPHVNNRPPGPQASCSIPSLDGTADERSVRPVQRTISAEEPVRPSASPEHQTYALNAADQHAYDTPQSHISQDAGPYSASVESRVVDDYSVTLGGSGNSPSNKESEEQPDSNWMWWRRGRKGRTFDIPSPQPKRTEDDEFPLSSVSPVTPRANPQATVNGQAGHSPSEKEKSKSKSKKVKIPFLKHETMKEGDTQEGREYPAAYNEEFEEDAYGEPLWKEYLKEGDRDTMRLPIFGWQWMISLPLIGKKVDTIYYCRKEIARLNVEIEQDQQEPEKFPLMNSAFIQFNHQVAAHMACQAVSHHLPKQMAPRLVEISPDDVLWDNMSVRWWERYLRMAVTFVIVCALVIGWAFPVTFTGLLSQIKFLTSTFKWLDWINRTPNWIQSIIQGILPQALLAGLMALLPMILRMLAKQQGVQTGMNVELSVQNYYFGFLFVQVFLVVSISSGITTVIKELSQNIGNTPALLAANLPRASNYFFSYMLLQAFSTSAGALVQVGSLISWFLLAPFLDNTARQKWSRQTNLSQMQWGTFFPVYTNLAAIGLIYSVISPLILVFNIITFGMFWVVYRYNTLYVTKFRFDTGGLLFPTAINQLFTGLYVMELCLIGLFFLVRDEQDKVACEGQAIIMIVVAIFTVLYQYLLNEAFGPLFKYLPITLEDDAVRRDEEFARMQRKRLNVPEEEDAQEEVEGEEEEGGEDVHDVFEQRKRQSQEQDRKAEVFEMTNLDGKNEHSKLDPRNLGKFVPKKSWADRTSNPKSPTTPRSKDFGHYPKRRKDEQTTAHDHIHKHHSDLEAQRMDPIGSALFTGINDEIEDLTPEERDKLVQRAFQHQALRAKRPVTWIPRDDLGVSDDEIFRTQRFSKHIWISNEYTGLDSKGRVVYRRSPPDFSEVDLIQL
ncbi:MAG: hypothetical protein M1827_004939 [Pycnora praestabilis]|nr:MAG: hypothetical protein M1827_004939 [Pycnora praestabilis]